jgi:hypothetical protein
VIKLKNKVALYKGHMAYCVSSRNDSISDETFRINIYSFYRIERDWNTNNHKILEKTDRIFDYELYVNNKDIEIKDFYEFEDTLKIVSHMKGKIICESQTNGLIYKITSGEIDRLYNLGKVVDQKIHGKWKFKNDSTYGTWSVQLIS